MAPSMKRPAKKRTETLKSDQLTFLKRKEGRWSLSLDGDFGRGSGVRQGDYRFEPSSGRLSSSSGRVLGQLLVRPLGQLPDCTGDAFLSHVLSVTSSEIMEEIQNKENAGADKAIVTDVDDYRYDRTAGPRGQLAAHLACAQFLLDNAKSSIRPTGLDALSRLLPALRKGEGSSEAKDFLNNLEVKNGYLMVPELEDDEAKMALPDVTSRLQAQLSKLRTVAMCEVPATGLAPSLKEWSKCRHHVNLIYASAVPVNAYSNTTESMENVRLQRAVASLLLRGAYFGALKLALETAKSRSKRKKIFLLPLGGGVFNNPFKDIAKAMVEALHMASGLCPEGVKLEEVLDIRVLTWKGKAEEAERFKHLLKELGQDVS